MIIVKIPDSLRDAHLPIRYAVRHKDFPYANFSCG